MTNYTEQIQRIKDKFPEAKKADRNLKVFGAESHKYTLGKPATLQQVAEFEERYGIELPDCYKSFVLHIGTGGTGYQESAAGPFFGIYPLGENTNELIFENSEKYLKNNCIIFPKMTDEYWSELTWNIDENDEINEDDYEREIGKLWGGILPIGSQGCTYLHGIVLNGDHKGRIVNLDMDRQKPKFAFEDNFLDWYERWLDEVISGELIKDGPSWFGYDKGGSEEALLASFVAANHLDEKRDNLNGLLNKNKLSDHSINQIESLIIAHAEPKKTLVQLLCKSDYEKAKPYLVDLIQTDLDGVFKFIFWYAKDKSKEWLPVIEANVHRIDDAETFRFCTYLLEETNIDFSTFIVRFTKNINEEIRIQAFYILGQLKNKKDYLFCFIEGLKDHSNRVVHATLQALSDVKDEKLLEHYKYLAKKFPVEQDYILINLNHRLAEYGLTNKTILN